MWCKIVALLLIYSIVHRKEGLASGTLVALWREWALCCCLGGLFGRREGDKGRIRPRIWESIICNECIVWMYHQMWTEDYFTFCCSKFVCWDVFFVPFFWTAQNAETMCRGTQSNLFKEVGHWGSCIMRHLHDTPTFYGSHVSSLFMLHREDLNNDM